VKAPETQRLEEASLAKLGALPTGRPQGVIERAIRARWRAANPPPDVIERAIKARAADIQPETQPALSKTTLAVQRGIGKYREAVVERLTRPSLSQEQREEVAGLIAAIDVLLPKLLESIRDAKRAGFPMTSKTLTDEAYAINRRVLNLGDALLSVEEATKLAAIPTLVRALGGLGHGDTFVSVLKSNREWLKRIIAE
jgi:hypothetical protein